MLFILKIILSAPIWRSILCIYCKCVMNNIRMVLNRAYDNVTFSVTQTQQSSLTLCVNNLILWQCIRPIHVTFTQCNDNGWFQCVDNVDWTQCSVNTVDNLTPGIVGALTAVWANRIVVCYMIHRCEVKPNSEPQRRGGQYTLIRPRGTSSWLLAICNIKYFLLRTVRVCDIQSMRRQTSLCSETSYEIYGAIGDMLYCNLCSDMKKLVYE